jgi:Alpha/beta hydrolase family
VYWGGVAVCVVFTLLLAHVPWRHTDGVLGAFARGFGHGLRLPTVTFYLAGLSVLGVLVRSGGRAAQLLGLLVSSALTLVTARKLRLQPSAPAATSLSAVVVGLVVLAALIVPRLTSTHSHQSAPAATRQGELVLVPGIDTSSGHGTLFLVHPRAFGFSCARTVYYSYAGTGRGAPRGQAVCPIRSGAPYTRADTERSLGALVSAFRAQVDSLAPPVTVVTHSAGSWVAWAALTGDVTSPVRRLVMLAPLTDPLGYPPPGTRGQGFVGAAGMRLVVQVGKSLGITRFDPDRPLATELLAQKGRVSNLFQEPLPPTARSLAIVSVFDSALFGDSTSTPFPRSDSACPLFETHSGLVNSSAAATDALQFLAEGRRTEPGPSCSPYAGWFADAGAAFGVP